MHRAATSCTCGAGLTSCHSKKVASTHRHSPSPGKERQQLNEIRRARCGRSRLHVHKAASIESNNSYGQGTNAASAAIVVLEVSSTFVKRIKASWRSCSRASSVRCFSASSPLICWVSASSCLSASIVPCAHPRSCTNSELLVFYLVCCLMVKFRASVTNTFSDCITEVRPGGRSECESFATAVMGSRRAKSKRYRCYGWTHSCA